MTRCACKVASCSSRVTTTTTRRGAAVVARGKKKGFLFGEVENLSREGEGTKGRRRGREERSMERTAGDREVPGEVPAGEERARGDVR